MHADDASPRADDEIERRREPLHWAPPEGWHDYDAVELPVDGGRLRLDPGIDYRLTADRPIEGPLEIIGGRNVVWIGGAIVIDRPEPVDELHRAIGLTIRDDDGSVDRTVHLEGLLLDGSGLNDGVNVDAPSAIVQLQNVHVAAVTFDGADDRDGTGPFDGMGRNHPDVVQVYGGHRELRIDGLTATSAYQGLPAVVMAPVVLPAVLGERWSDMVPAFQVLVVAGVLHGVLNIGAEFLSGTGNVDLRGRLSLAWALGMVVLLLVVVPRYGVVGAAFVHLGLFVPLAVATAVLGPDGSRPRCVK
jgi:hypothetical protein